MDHVDSRHRQHFLQVVHCTRLLDHDGYDDITQGLYVRLRAAIAHVGEATRRHPVRATVFGRFRTDNAHALLYVRGGAAIGEQDAVKP